jgi:hypothetical protein
MNNLGDFKEVEEIAAEAEKELRWEAYRASMSKLTYWKIACISDHDCFSQRFRTKREAVVEWKSMLEGGEAYERELEDSRGNAYKEWVDYEPPEKVEVFYTGGVFGLMEELLSE